MERRKFFTRLGMGTLAACTAMPLMSNNRKEMKSSSACSLKKGEIQHMVIFDMNHEIGSVMADKFLSDAQQILSNIPVVQNFQVFNQVSLKNHYAYGFSMVFADQSAYYAYNHHPDHMGFVADRWDKEVTQFLEIDFKSV